MITVNGFYQAQGILTQDEVEKFMEYTKKPLPLSFRLTLGKRLDEILKNLVVL